MAILGRLAGWLARRYARRTLARAVVVLAVALLVTQVVVVWYAASVGLSLRDMAYADDDRVVVIDAEDRERFARHYDPDREVGWCLYGSVDDARIRIDAVVRATPLSSGSSHIEFTCLRETAGQLVGGKSARLIGTAHSHPSKNRSRLSRVDTMTWGRTSPVVEVMGIYTATDGVEFFTVSSMLSPLETECVDCRHADAERSGTGSPVDARLGRPTSFDSRSAPGVVRSVDAQSTTLT